MTALRSTGMLAALAVVLSPSALAQDPIHSFSGAGAADHLGQVLATADMNGDGVADVIVASPLEDANGIDSGAVRVLSGEFMATTAAGGTPLTAEVLLTVPGGAAFDNFGTSLAVLGDVDLDGTPDLVVGAPYDDTAAENAGAAHVISGATGAVLKSFFGVGVNDWFGFSVAALGDLDEDGIPDLAAAALAPNIIGGGVEYVRVVSTGPETTRYTLFANPIEDGQFGFSMASTDDLDGDGERDLLVGARNLGTFQSGRVRVFSGETGQLVREHDGESGERFGWSVASVGDLNKDGVGDYAAGGPGFQSSAGRARVWSGANGALLISHVGSNDAQAGFSVSGYGDLDGDGRDDVLVGAPGDAASGVNAGSAVLLSGKDGAELLRVDGAAGIRFGEAVAGLADIDGDTFADIVVGAPYASDLAADGGRVTAFSGGCGGPIATYGTSCVGSGGFAPALTMSGCMEPGGSVTLRIDQALGGGIAMLFVGINQASIPAGGGCFLNVAPIVSQIGPLPLFGSGPGNGFFQISSNLPVTAAPGTARLAAACADVGAELGFTLTNGVEFTIID